MYWNVSKRWYFHQIYVVNYYTMISLIDFYWKQIKGRRRWVGNQQIIKNLEKLQKNRGNYVENISQISTFCTFEASNYKKIGNPGTRVLKLKNLTCPKAKKPGYPGFQVPGFRTLISNKCPLSIYKATFDLWQNFWHTYVLVWVVFDFCCHCYNNGYL